MTVLPWLPDALGTLPITSVIVRAGGAARWANLVRTHTRVLEAGRVGALGGPSSARFDEHDQVCRSLCCATSLRH